MSLTKSVVDNLRKILVVRQMTLLAINIFLVNQRLDKMRIFFQ